MIRFPPRKILVAFDQSSASVTAWRHAESLARQLGASVEVLYVEPWAVGVGSYPLPTPIPSQVRLIRRKIRAVVGEQVKVLVVEGDAAQRILSVARGRQADLIVMGTHGRSGLERALLGSVAEAVMRASSIPVLAARGPAKKIRSILAPLYFNSNSNAGFVYAAHAAAALGAHLTALYVNVDPVWGGNPLMRLTSQIESLPAKLHVRCEAVVETEEDAAPAIIKAARRHDVIALVEHGKSAIMDALFGTTAEKVLRGSKKSILVVPAPRVAVHARPRGKTAAA